VINGQGFSRFLSPERDDHALFSFGGREVFPILSGFKGGLPDLRPWASPYGKRPKSLFLSGAGSGVSLSVLESVSSTVLFLPGAAKNF